MRTTAIRRAESIEAPSAGRFDRLIERALAPVSGASSAVLRIAFGLMVVWTAGRFVAMGWVDQLLVDPTFHFSYPGLGWVAPLPAPLLYALYGVVAASGLAIALGWRYRLAAVVFVALFVYVESIDAAIYLNHYELITLVGVLACVLPLHARWSLDARAGRIATGGLVPSWVVWLLRFQLAVVYVFAGLGKLNVDWLVHGEPLHTWLSGRTDQWLVGPMLGSLAVAIAMSWAGALFDLTIVGWLLWRRSRLIAYVVLVVFHVFTARLFPPIGVFPWVMIVLTPIFFDPDWPERAARWVPGRPTDSAPVIDATEHGDAVLARPRTRVQTAAVVLVVAYCLIQVVVPLRHFAYPGDVRWTEEGYRWSWRVMLTEKVGTVRFEVVDPHTGDRTMVWPSDELAVHQERYMAVRPEAIAEYARHLAAEVEAETGVRPAVYADGWVTINGRTRARLVDPAVDLAAVAPGWGPAPWIEPQPE